MNTKQIIIAIVGGGVFIGGLFSLNGYVVEAPLTKCEELEIERVATNNINKRFTIISAMAELDCPQLRTSVE
jgi:hypothetical protein